jgi:iron(III) transport system substrate-binding protein
MPGSVTRLAGTVESTRRGAWATRRIRRPAWAAASLAVVAALVLACGGGTGSSGASGAGAKPQGSAGSGASGGSTAFSPELQKVIDGAKAEGEVVYCALVPFRETLNQIGQAMNKRFGTNIKVTFVPVDARETPQRFLAEANQPAASCDVAWSLLNGPLPMYEAGILPTYPWVETFGAALPSIKDRVERIEEPLRGRVLESWTLLYGVIYDTRVIKAEELPKTWTDLGDPKYAGRFSTDPAATAYSFLGMVMGEDAIIDVVRRVKANRPIYGRSAVDVVERVVSGEAAFAISTISTGEAKRLQGAPVDGALMDPVSAIQTVVYMPQNPAHPNAARLFTAFFATDAVPILEEVEGHGLIWAESGSKMAKRVETAKVRVSMPTTVDDARNATNIGRRAAETFSAP